VTTWLDKAVPDIALLQEIKCEAEAFPRRELEALGYSVIIVGQRAYNGVALLSKRPLEAPLTRLPGESEDTQARYVEATVDGLGIASIYLPNGNPVASDKYPYKLRWIERLRAHAATLLAAERPFVLGGDFNVIPAPEDVYDPAAWSEDALYRLETRRAFRALVHLGLTDAYRALHAEPRAYTFWDYQAGRFWRDEGLRIDHFLLSPQAADRLVACTIDRAPRSGERASDHTPVMLELLDRG
jgi:exodeoxyribonuclease-3